MQKEIVLELVYKADACRYATGLPIPDATTKTVESMLDEIGEGMPHPHTTMTVEEIRSCAERLNELRDDPIVRLDCHRLVVGEGSKELRAAISWAIREHLQNRDRAQAERRVNFNGGHDSLFSRQTA
jgi:hypothetical protein